MKIFNSLSDELVEYIKQGKIGVIPTDTVYGLVCLATNESAVNRLYALKSREDKPGPVIAADINQLLELGVDARDIAKAAKYWPNPVSFILSSPLDYLSQGRGSQPFRIPKQKEIREFLGRTGALLTSSANSPGKPPSTNLQEALNYFDDSVDYYVDYGEINNPPSTIAKLNGNEIEIIRRGSFEIS